MHSLIARVTCTGWVSAPRDEDFGLDPERAARVIDEHQPDLTFLTSPNNPTGTAAPIGLIEAVCAAAPGLVVIDEAYAEFAREGTPSALTLLPRYPRLVVTRTMSKAFAMAGARIGYLAAAPEVVEKLLLVRLPYHLSAVTQAVARAALALAAEPLATVSETTDRTGWARRLAPAAGPFRGGLRRELRAVRRVRLAARGLARAARPGRARPRGRPAALAASHRGHAGGDDGVQVGAR